MSPADFPEATTKFGPPKDLEESQCGTIPAHGRIIDGGSLDGLPVIVTAFKPTEDEIANLQNGGLIYLATVGPMLAPHLLTTSFWEATHPA